VWVALGAPAHLLGFGIAQLISTATWPIAILGSVSLGAGLAWASYRLWHSSACSVPLTDRTLPGGKELADQFIEIAATDLCSPADRSYRSRGM
jgi:hypothetical protein